MFSSELQVTHGKATWNAAGTQITLTGVTDGANQYLVAEDRLTQLDLSGQPITGDLAGIPCMSVPCGRTVAGLPVGMQILTSHFAETTMFQVAHAFESARDF